MVTTQSSWELHPRVSIRPEPFGALLYHFGTRKLSFLKDPVLVDLVRALDKDTTVNDACSTVGIVDAERPRYVRALNTLAESHMIEECAA